MKEAAATEAAATEAAATETKPTENKPTETKPKVIKPSFYDKPEPTPPAEPAEPTETWTKANRLVKNTAEYSEFIEAVKAQGGYITDTYATRNKQGLSVQYMLPGGKRI